MESESLVLGLSGSSRPPEPSAWWNYPVSKDVVVEVRCDSSPWRLKQVRSLIAQMIRQLNENDEKDHPR